jgi:rod shape-determining protein MreC
MKKKKNKKKIKYIFFVVFLFLIITVSFYYFLNDNRNNNIIFKISKDLSANITKALSLPYTYNENNTNDVSSEINKDLENEIKYLKDTLELNEVNSDKTLVNANVIKRSITYWYNIITIDKGSKDGIVKGNAVINSSGLVGKIIKVNYSTSDIKLLISKKDNNYISAVFYIDDVAYYGLIDEYDIEKNELYLKNVIGDFDINKIKGINVVTSGLSDSFSSGLLIGKIKEINKEEFGISNTIKITPSANFNDLKILTVIIGDKS